jgi:hypothetical protein
MEVMPVDLVGLTAVILGCLMLLIPIAGLTARFAIKPIAEALAMKTGSGADGDAIQLLERRLALLEQEVHGLAAARSDLTALIEELEFRKQLAQPHR